MNVPATGGATGIRMGGKLRGWATTFCVVGLAAYFAGHALTGDRGVLAWAGDKARLAALESELASAEALRVQLEERAQRLREDRLDVDYLDERARALAGVAHPRDLIIPAEALPPELRLTAVDARGGRP